MVRVISYRGGCGTLLHPLGVGCLMASWALDGFWSSSSGHSDLQKLLSSCPGLLVDTMDVPTMLPFPLISPASCSTGDCEEGPERPWYLQSNDS